jgi:hypothetical protein
LQQSEETPTNALRFKKKGIEEVLKHKERLEEGDLG